MIDPCDHCHRSETPGGGHIVEEGTICRGCFADLYTRDECPRCHQGRARHHGSELCVVCLHLDRQPQGEAVRLFEPAPTQIEGQMFL